MPSKKPAKPGTLGFLGECGMTVYIVCGKCGRFTVAKLEEIAKRTGWRANADEVGKRLRCSDCGHRGAKLTTQRPQAGRAVCPRCLRPFGPRSRL
nr:hypothetical protein [Gammaproteobacteria bacterium]